MTRRALCIALVTLFATGARASELPILTRFDFDVPGTVPSTSHAPYQPDSLETSATGYMFVAPTALGLMDKPVLIHDALGNYQGMTWDLFSSIDYGSVRIELAVSVADLTSGWFFVASSSSGTPIARLEIRNDGTIRPSYPFSTVLGHYQPGQPFRVRAIIDLDTDTYTVQIDNELDGFEDDPPSVTLFSMLPAAFGRFECGLGVPPIEGTMPTTCAIDDILIEPFPSFELYKDFVRGDANADGSVNLTDVLLLLDALFVTDLGLITCRDAGDVNDTGRVDVADAIRLTALLFMSSPPPPAPYPGCGYDPTFDAVTCEIYDGCP